MQKVNVEVTDKNAIYVDGMRITNRNTKWGIHNIIAEFSCRAEELPIECSKRGLHKALECIEEKEYKNLIKSKINDR